MSRTKQQSVKHNSLSKPSNSTSPKKFRATIINSPHLIEKTLPIFQSYIKEYPLDISEDIIEIVKMIEPLQAEFAQNLKSLKLYKQQLGTVFEQNWCDFLAYLKLIVIKMKNRTQKLLAEKENKINLLLDTIKNMELQKIQIQAKLDKVHNLRELENAQLVMANNELDIVNRQMRNIYKILQSDMSKVMLYLTTLEQKRQKLDENISNEMNSSLKDLSALLDTVKKEQHETDYNLSTMNEMIKAMTKSVKVHTGVQVDESELHTNVGQIFTKGNTTTPLEVAQGISINISSVNQLSSTLQKLKIRQKQLPHESYQPKKSIEKPWALTPSLLIFLQNMSKQNEIGRVLPWDYVKQIISEVYDERVKYQSQISTSIVGNSMSFDEFLIFFFVVKFKMRRLAEVKLLEFIISLKYYSKFWIKAQLFCCLLDVMKFQPYSDPSEASIYKFDLYAQNYFFSIYKHIKKFNLFHDSDGTVYTYVQSVKKLVKNALFFTDELSKSRILSKLEKNIRIFNKVEHCDLDFSIQAILDEYFAIKKKNFALISKAFSKTFDKNKGYFSIGELGEVFDCLNSMYRKWDDSIQQYPIQSQLYIGKLYLYSITSGKNNNEITINNFLSSVQKYGFDCPYPFIRTVMRKKSAKQQLKPKESKPIPESTVVTFEVESKKVVAPLPQMPQMSEQKQIENSEEMGKTNVNFNMIKVDAASKLFSQHFCILKQLNDYVKIFGETLSNQKNPQVLWKSFNQIKAILERGCSFLKYPLVKEKVK